jgi:hypothetical protein
MSTPYGGVVPRTVAGEVIQPTAMIDGKSEATHAVANVLRTLVQRSVGAYHNETDLDNALRAVSTWERGQINASTLNALHNESPGQADKEDVSLRLPPNSTGPVSATIAQSIDYNRLAAAVAAHMLAAQQANAEPSSEVSPSE